MEPLKGPIESWQGTHIAAGQSRDLHLVVGESYSGMNVQIPIHVSRGREDGPTVFVTAALHGDEINGTGAIRALLQNDELNLDRGTLILAPVLNILGFDRHSRYLPDRRDLNRAFPGSLTGSLASRMARRIFDETVFFEITQIALQRRKGQACCHQSIPRNILKSCVFCRVRLTNANFMFGRP